MIRTICIFPLGRGDKSTCLFFSIVDGMFFDLGIPLWLTAFLRNIVIAVDIVKPGSLDRASADCFCCFTVLTILAGECYRE